MTSRPNLQSAQSELDEERLRIGNASGGSGNTTAIAGQNGGKSSRNNSYSQE